MEKNTIKLQNFRTFRSENLNILMLKFKKWVKWKIKSAGKKKNELEDQSEE